MAAKKRTKIGIKKSQTKKFFRAVGALGGKATKKKLGKAHFQRIANLSHQARARNREAAAAESAAGK